MRILLIISLLLSQVVTGQVYFGRIASSGGGGAPTIPGQLTLIYDDFSGSSLNSRWKVRRPDMTTVTVSGGYARVQVDTDTIPQMPGYSYSNITTQAMIYDTSFGLNCRRNYTLEQGFYIDKINDTTLGAFTGPYCPFPVDYPFSGFGHYQFSGPDTIRILGGKDTMFTYPPSGHLQTSAVPVNTTDYYVLRFTVFENEAKVTFVNRTTGDSVSKAVTFQMTSGGWLARPSYFYYAFGLMGRSIVRYDYMHVYTPEELNPKWLVMGDSKPTGYNATTADSAYGNMLKRNTTDSVQIYAGGGMGVDEVLLVLKDVWRVNPQYVIFDIGTNNTFNSTNYNKYTQIIDSLTAHGITSYKLMQPNGGTLTGGSWNQWIKDNFPTTYIDDYTSPGYATQTIGNGQMYDGVHETLSGTQIRYSIIKAALIAFFPL